MRLEKMICVSLIEDCSTLELKKKIEMIFLCLSVRTKGKQRLSVERRL